MVALISMSLRIICVCATQLVLSGGGVQSTDCSLSARIGLGEELEHKRLDVLMGIQPYSDFRSFTLTVFYEKISL